MRLNSDETSSSDGGGTEGILWSVGVRNGVCSSMGSILGVIFFGMSVDEELGSVYRFRSKQGTIESIFCNYSRDFVKKEIRENSVLVCSRFAVEGSAAERFSNWEKLKWRNTIGVLESFALSYKCLHVFRIEGLGYNFD